MIYLNTIIIFIAITLLAVLIGRRILGLLRLTAELSRIEKLLFSFALGLGFVSFLVFFMGITHALYLKRIGIILFITALFSLNETMPLFNDILAICSSGYKQLGAKGLRRFLGAAMLVSLLVTFLGALAPEKGNDSLIYHLADAKYFARHGLVTFIPYTSNSVWPYFMQMLFTLAMLLRNILLAKLFHFSMAIFSALAVYSLARRYFEEVAAFIAMVVFLLTPGVFTQATYAYIDLGLTFYTLMSFYALYLWLRYKKQGLIALAAMMAGIAADTKYLGAVVPGIIIFILLITAPGLKVGIRGLVKALMLFLLLAGAVMLPWYSRPYLYTGNPLYPFYVKYIAESGWGHPSGFGMKKDILNILLSPWALTFYPDTVFAGGESQLGPIYIAFLPALIFIRKRPKFILSLIVFIIIFYFFWFFVFPAARYILPLIPFLAILAGWLVSDILGWQGVARKMILGMFIVIILLNLAFCFYYNREEIAFFLSGADTETYLAREDRSSAIYQYINKNTPASSRIFLVNELRTLYLNREYLSEFYYRLYDKYQLRPSEEIIADLRAKGISYILDAELTEGARGPRSGQAEGDNRMANLLKDENFVNKYLERVNSLDYSFSRYPKVRYTLYKLK